MPSPWCASHSILSLHSTCPMWKGVCWSLLEIPVFSLSTVTHCCSYRICFSTLASRRTSQQEFQQTPIYILCLERVFEGIWVLISYTFDYHAQLFGQVQQINQEVAWAQFGNKFIPFHPSWGSNPHCSCGTLTPWTCWLTMTPQFTKSISWPPSWWNPNHPEDSSPIHTASSSDSTGLIPAQLRDKSGLKTRQIELSVL